MPEAHPDTVVLNGHEVHPGKAFHLGVIRHTEQQIIDFARVVDPLPIHIDPEAGRRSIFGGLIASGSMLYIEAHRTWFIHMFGPSIVCGLGVRNWNFTKPHYPETDYKATLTARELIRNPDRPTVQVEWYYTFHGEDGTLVQDLELPVLHWHSR